MIENPFHSFWMAGYECADHINAFGNRVDLLSETGHLAALETDYRDLGHFDIRTVREGVRWSQVERIPFHYDWGVVTHMIRQGRRLGIQQVWDLCHFGFPDDLTPLHPMFARRFARFCRAFVLHYRSLEPDACLIVTPINEVSFLSWLGGDVRGTVPFCVRQGWEVKYALMRAYIEGVYAMQEIDRHLRIMTTEPLVNIVPAAQSTYDQLIHAAQLHEQQFQSIDMLRGSLCPELGGSPQLADILGFNYYAANQWIADAGTVLPWTNDPPDERWRPLSTLFNSVWQRYHLPMVLSETSHPGIDRPAWIHHIGEQVQIVQQQGMPIWGVCLYPIIDRPDWDNLHHWHHSGLWDTAPGSNNATTRILHEAYATALRQVQHQNGMASQ
ncbi:amine oxidase [Paraflavitalea pollutisoli]|uniref:amine oxidase n=1 Tax=Paraflavitalea pollutisoli TaxID=3034143 RepID=UPI0023ED554B|nr:amine oxidase [Paraflavitalea sp. H1-2-19X]